MEHVRKNLRQKGSGLQALEPQANPPHSSTHSASSALAQTQNSPAALLPILAEQRRRASELQALIPPWGLPMNPPQRTDLALAIPEKKSGWPTDRMQVQAVTCWARQETIRRQRVGPHPIELEALSTAPHLQF